MQLELPLSQPTSEQPSPEDVAVLVAAELLVPVRRTADGRVTEYQWSWLGRRMLGYSDPCERP